MYQIVDLKLVTETLQEMKQQFEEEKRVILIARKDISAITSLLAKMKQLPIISRLNCGNDFTSISSTIPEIKLEKLIKEIHNYSVFTEDLTIEINIHDQQLEEKRLRDIEKEIMINLYNNIHNEVDFLINKYEIQKNLLKRKEEELNVLTNDIELSTLDIDFIEDRLDARTKLFEDYMKSNKITDYTIQQIITELGKHIQDIKILSNEFISYKIKNTNPEHVHELLKKIKEKEDILDHASDLLKKYDEKNTSLQQLFDAIRLNNMTNIFELLIKNFKKMVLNMALYKKEITNIRSEISEIEENIKIKKEQLDVLLGDIINHMKIKLVSYPTNCNNKDLLEYFTNIYNLKKENQILKNLLKKIKTKGTEVVTMCRNIINFQEKENEKLSSEICLKTDLIKNLQQKFYTLHNEVHENSKIIYLQTKLINIVKENEQLLLMNTYLKKNDVQLKNDVKNAKQKLNYLEIENAELYESNTELMHSNTDLTEKLSKMRKYVQLVRRNLRQLQIEETEDVYTSPDSDDSFNHF